VRPTSLTVDKETLERLREYRTDDHYTWDEAINDLLHTVPSAKKLREGCDQCGERILRNRRRSDSHTVVESYTVDEGGEQFHVGRLYCCIDCARQANEEANAWVPENPEKVTVGGKSETRAEVEDATFYLDRDRMEVGIPVPGAFGGGDEYDYEGEPVYVHNKGRVVQKGVIENIIHEETHTALILGHGHETVMRHHPNEEKREEWAEKQAEGA